MADRRSPPWPGDIANQGRRRKPWRERCCRLCARPDLPTSRHLWHPKCTRLADAAFSRWGAVQWTMRRQRGRCAGCSKELAKADRKRMPSRRRRAGYKPEPYWQPFEAIEVDHLVPLWKVALMPAPRCTAIRWWLPGNLQGLCRSCHRAKTKREAGERAAARRSGG